MRIRAVVLMLTVGLLALGAASAPVEAQSPVPPLPADLLFTTTTAAGDVDYPRNTIVRVNAETLEVTRFYVDQEADQIMPISWSPQGDLLAVYRIMPALDEAYTLFPRQLCILDRAGRLQRCLEDCPPTHYAGLPDHDWQHYYPVTWGPDGRTVFFDTEYPIDESPNGYGRRLVEASVVTGETLRTVYDYADAYQVARSPNLGHVGVGFGEEWFRNSPAYIFDLTTGARLDVPDLVPELTSLSWACLPF